MKQFLASIVLVTSLLIACNQTGKNTVQNSLLTEQRIATLRAAYAAFNRGDIAAAVQSLDPQIDWSEPAEFPGGGNYKGREAAKQYLTDNPKVMDEISGKVRTAAAQD